MEILCKRKYGTIDNALKIANLDKSTIFTISKGSVPNIAILKSFAKALDVSTDYLLGLTDNPEKKEFSQTNNIKPKYQVLYENLSHTAQELICKHMANILESEGVNVKELLAIHL